MTRSVFFARSRFDGALAVCDDLEHPAAPSPRLHGARPAHVDLARLREWHAAWWRAESMAA